MTNDNFSLNPNNYESLNQHSEVVSYGDKTKKIKVVLSSRNTIQNASYK